MTHGQPWPGVIAAYRDYLPVSGATPVVTLLEGGTPLVDAPRLSEQTGARVLLKLEGLNPTGSFKDRGMTLAMSKAVEDGAKAVICASTGNTSASAAAYAARAGLTAAVVIPEGKIAAGKLAQALMHGARVLALEGGFDDALSVVRSLVERHPIALVNSLNEHRIDGQRTAAFEVCDDLGDAPDALCIPVGNAGNVSAYWLGFQAYREAERSRGLPRLYGFQAAGAAPLVDGAPVARPETVATAIRIGKPARGEQAMAAMRESGGGVAAVTDSEILEAYRLLAAEEGVFCEPASAASVAGLMRRAEAGDLAEGETVVCVLTGHGLKDPDTAIVNSEAVRRLPADLAAVEEAVLG
jgi:threonine synthase